MFVIDIIEVTLTLAYNTLKCFNTDSTVSPSPAENISIGTFFSKSL